MRTSNSCKSLLKFQTQINIPKFKRKYGELPCIILSPHEYFYNFWECFDASFKFQKDAVFKIKEKAEKKKRGRGFSRKLPSSLSPQWLHCLAMAAVASLAASLAAAPQGG